jgi:hypothetical protein
MARGFRSARGKRELGFAHSIRFRVLRVGRRVRASCDGQEVAREHPALPHAGLPKDLQGRRGPGLQPHLPQSADRLREILG